MSIQPQTLSEVRALAQQSLGDPESSQHFQLALGVTPEAFAALDEQAQAKHLQQLQAGGQIVQGSVVNYSDLSSDELKLRGAALLSSFVTKAALEPDVLSSFDTQMHLRELGESLRSCMESAEGYPNANFNGLAESVARCLVLYEEKPDVYAQIVRGVCSSDSEMFLDTFEGLRLLNTLQRGLADDHDYSFNAGTGTIERVSEDTAGDGLYPALLREILESSQRGIAGHAPDYTEQIKLMSEDKFEFSKAAVEAFRKLGEHVFSNPAESYPWGGRARMLARRVVLQKYLTNEDVIQAAWIHEQSKRNDPDWFGKDAGMGHLAKLMDERSNGRWREEQDAVSKAAPTAMEYVRAEHADVEQYFVDQLKRENVQERRAAMHIVEASQDDSSAPGM